MTKRGCRIQKARQPERLMRFFKEKVRSRAFSKRISPLGHFFAYLSILILGLKRPYYTTEHHLYQKDTEGTPPYASQDLRLRRSR